MTRSSCSLLAAAALLASACVSVRSLEQARPSSAGHLLRIDGDLVFTEQVGQGEPVLLLHGFGASAYSWRLVMPRLGERFRVLAPDLYGFGWTDRPGERGKYTREGQVELILQLMGALGLEEAHIVGHSYGGSIAMALAADHPDRVRSLVLVDAAAVDYPMTRRKWFPRFRLFNWIYVRGLALRTGTIERVLYGVYYDDSLVTDDVIRSYSDRLRVEGAAKGYRGLSRPLPRSQRPREIHYQEIAVPTLVLWGAQDSLISVESARYYAGLFPDARFVAIEAAGHSPMEEKPEEFLTLVTAFLDEIQHREEEPESAAPLLDSR